MMIGAGVALQWHYSGAAVITSVAFFFDNVIKSYYNIYIRRALNLNKISLTKRSLDESRNPPRPSKPIFPRAIKEICHLNHYR